ncbi:MAG TPA: hypothetical protein VFY78_09755, partial [Gammaproteobacteria bacterium]|nr:hypothetical protein [Gammaproteobacteria bacterium]
QQQQDQQQAMKKEFEDYKTKTAKEFIEYKKSFDLQANRVVSFEGNRVSERNLDESFGNQFGDFESFAGQHIKAYRELDESVK